MEGTANHPRHVGVHGGRCVLEGEAGDRTGGVLPDAGQSLERFQVVRDPAAVIRHDDLRQPVQVHGTPVVTQSFPALPHLGRMSAREGVNRGIAPEKLSVVELDPRHLRLLEHELGDQHFIRIARVAPGEVATGTPVPAGEAVDGRSGIRVWAWSQPKP